MKDLKNLKGAKMLSKNEQRAIKGGLVACDTYHFCRPGTSCHITQTVYDENGVLIFYSGYCVPEMEM
jgi:hypothetical protein